MSSPQAAIRKDGASTAVERLLAPYPALAAAQAPAWLAELRAAGLARFRARGLPTRRDEAWRWTSLAGLEKVSFGPADPTTEIAFDGLPPLLPDRRPHRLVFVEGRFEARYSDIAALPEGATLASLAEVIARSPERLEGRLGEIAEGSDQPLLDLNTALIEDGLVLILPQGCKLERPVEALFLAGTGKSEAVSHPRLFLDLSDRSEAIVIERHYGLAGQKSFANPVTEFALGVGARLDHCRVVAESTGGLQVATLHGRIAEGARYEGFTLTLGAGTTRNEATLNLDGSGAYAGLHGAYLLDGTQHCDTTTEIRHRAPGTTCREVFKGVVDGKARAVFQGRLRVERDAQKTDGHQLAKALLLSDEAEFDAKPELKIYADDVKCSHGAAAGEIDREALFYLATRGLPRQAAERLLIEAFVGEAVDEIAVKALREAIRKLVAERLDGKELRP